MLVSISIEKNLYLLSQIWKGQQKVVRFFDEETEFRCSTISEEMLIFAE